MRPAYVIALILTLIVAYCSTGRADQVLAPIGLNVTDCYQLFGTTYCGDEGKRFKEAHDARFR